MENVPVIWFHGIKPPNATKEIKERYHNWFDAAYFPLVMKDSAVTEIKVFKIINQIKDYPEDLGVWQFNNLKGYEEHWNLPEQIAILKDLQTTWPQYGREVIWEPLYQPLVSFRSNLIDFSKNKAKVDSPILNINAFKFSVVEWERFNAWFSECGCQAFLPLFKKVDGLEEYHCLKWTGVVRPAAKLKEYPIFMALSYFDSLNTSQHFIESPEMAAFLASIKLGFPNGFASQWNVQYQLVKSFRK